MRLSHPDYIKLVVGAYKKKQKESKLPPLLTTLTRSNIRQECLNVYNERIEKGEKEETDILRAFFGVPPAGKNFGYLIEKSELDDFRPLENLMKKRVKNPAMVNVELLAWLIDFRFRPYVFDKQVILNDDELAILGKKGDDPDNGGKPKNEDELPNGNNSNPASQGKTIENRKKKKLKTTIAVFLIAASCLGGAYIIGQGEGFKGMPAGNANTGCMYWAGEQYKEIPCTEERKDRLKLPKDLEKMKSFRRITLEDTITERSIGKVYYIKINGTIEYYTTGGNHPVDVTRSLHPLSPYMYDKYLKKQEIAKKDL